MVDIKQRLADAAGNHDAPFRTESTTLNAMIGVTFGAFRVTDDVLSLFTNELKGAKLKAGHGTYRVEHCFYHDQDCCETVEIEEIHGNLESLIGRPILQAYYTQSHDNGGEGSQTWTFYHFRTVKGDVTVRWLGESNGYYSEEVDYEIFVDGQITSLTS